MRLFKVAAGKPIWATVHSSRAILERPAEIFSSIFFQLYWWRKTPGAPPGIISGTSGHLGRTTDIPLASWMASSHERFRPEWGSNLQQRDLLSQVSDFNHSATEAPIFICVRACSLYIDWQHDRIHMDKNICASPVQICSPSAAPWHAVDRLLFDNSCTQRWQWYYTISSKLDQHNVSSKTDLYEAIITS
jgi:hypothetical protein